MTQDLNSTETVANDIDPNVIDSDRTQADAVSGFHASTLESQTESLEKQIDLVSELTDQLEAISASSSKQVDGSETAVSLETDAPLKRNVISSNKDFESLQNVWSEFNVDLMNSFSWNFSWWNAFQDQGNLHLLTFKQAGDVVGIAPFYVDHWFGLKRLRFLASGDTSTDYVDLICDREHYDRCAHSVSEYIREQRFDVVELECPKGDRLSESLMPALESAYDYDHRDVEPTWLLSLPSEWTDFLSARRSSLRRKIKKAVRRLDSSELQIKTTSEGLPMESALETLKDLHTRRMNSTGKPGVFANQQFDNFLTNLVMDSATEGQVEIIVALKNNVSVGAQIYFDSSQGYQLYQSGYAPEAMKLEPGHLLFTEMIKRAIERGDQQFDFLRGNEPYKKYWEAKPHAQKKLRMISKRLLPRAISKLVETTRRMVRGQQASA